MKLITPFPVSTIGQKFGDNQVNYQSVDGTIGHPGDDYEQPYGTPIPNAIEGAVVSCLLSKDNPNLDAFRAVNTIYEDSTGCYEIQYGHVSTINVVVGQILPLGTIVAAVGNTGTVFSGTPLKEVTEADKLAGSHSGSHLHFQVRKLNKIPVGSPSPTGMHFLNDGVERLVLNGNWYEVPNWDNGYDGCVDPQQFFDDLDADIQAEVNVLKTQTDPTVRFAFIKLLISQARQKLGF